MVYLANSQGLRRLGDKALQAIISQAFNRDVSVCCMLSAPCQYLHLTVKTDVLLPFLLPR